MLSKLTITNSNLIGIFALYYNDSYAYNIKYYYLGTIPSSIGSLHFLHVLFLSGTSIAG